MAEPGPDVVAMFFAARQLEPPERRPTFLAQTCGIDTDLRQRVEVLLQCDKEAADFLKPPRPIVLLAGLVRALRKAGQSEKADEAVRHADAFLTKGLERNPGAATYCNRGSFYLEFSEYAKAEADYSRAVELDPDEWRIWLARGCVRAAMGKWHESASDFTKAATRRPAAPPDPRPQ